MRCEERLAAAALSAPAELVLDGDDQVDQFGGYGYGHARAFHERYLVSWPIVRMNVSSTRGPE